MMKNTEGAFIRVKLINNFFSLKTIIKIEDITDYNR